MTRSANRNAPTRPATVLTFAPHEFKHLKHNDPGPSGLLGGYQRLENHIVAHTDSTSLRCPLDDKRLPQLIRCIQKYGDGGPNRRLRAACIPALRRAGIELQPGWSA